MPDDSGKGGIPAWQRASDTDSSSKEVSSSTTDRASEQPETPDEASVAAQPDDEHLLAKARAFLQDESLRDSPLIDKVTFLQSKGVAGKIIDEAVATTSSNPNTTITTPTTTTPTMSSSAASAPARQSDVPPIITYPEFLIHSSKPPPIITARRLINTAYVAAGASALVYGASKYLITPMSESLSAARHDFAHHTQEQLAKLNAALEGVVSTDPAMLTSTLLRQHDSHMRSAAGHDEYADDASSDSDPTELFHRDFGTQTADLPAPGAPASEATSEDSRIDETPADAQTRQLHRLRTLCKDAAAEEVNEADTAQEVSSAVKLLEEQLAKLSMPRHSPSAYGIYDNSTADQKRDGDEIGKMKAEIRSVKGVLLSAKNFPGSNSGARRVGVPT